MTANKSDKVAARCRGKGARDMPERCQSVSPPPTAPAVRVSPYPLSDGEDTCAPRRTSQHPGAHTALRVKNRNAAALTSDCHSHRLLKSRGICRLENRLSVFKPVGGGSREQKENRLEVQTSGHGESAGQQRVRSPSPKTSPVRPTSPAERPRPEASPGNVSRKLPRWEYCKVELPRMSLYVEKRALGERVGGSEGCPSLLSSPCSEKNFDFQDMRKVSTAFSECSYPGTEDEAAPEGRRPPGGFEKKPSRREAQALLLRSLSSRPEGSAVLSRVQKIEQALRDGLAKPLQFPSSCYSSERPVSKLLHTIKQQSSGSKPSNISAATKPQDKRSAPQQMVTGCSSGVENPDSESLECFGGVAVNPIPKPKRTFEYEINRPQERASSPNSVQSPRSPFESQPLLTSTPATQIAGKQKDGSRLTREDGPNCLASGCSSPKANGSVSTATCYGRSSKGSSQENNYEDILLPCRESPYEDVDVRDRRSHLPQEKSQNVPHRKCAASTQKSTLSLSTNHRGQRAFTSVEQHSHSERLLGIHPSTCSLPDGSLGQASGTLSPRQHGGVPKLVQRINSIFRSRRGKKRLKKLSQSTTEMSSIRDDNSESESDTDDRFNVHTERLLRLQSLLCRAPSYGTRELQLLRGQERRELFELFVVVALKKKPPKSSYTPEVTYQFPKLERLTKQMKEAEERIKAIPQFCFPDAKDWSPVSQYSSETFSFMLTGEDGGRRFGYCRRLLPTGNGPRLPEVYCVISRLGCFHLFSKILDEVERRRGISAALVYPFMRSIMESPFPAPGRTITLKTFLPGAGKEELALRRPSDPRLEHVELQSLFSCLSVPLLLRVFASLLLERRVIFVADKLSTLSSCAHAVLALLYPFSWQHTFIPVLPAPMLDMVCCPTPFLVGLLSSSLPRLQQLPLEETLMVDLQSDRFIRQMDDEATLLPRKLQAALEQALEQRDDLISQDSDSEAEDDSTSLNSLVSEAFIRFFLETVGHYPLFLTQNASSERFLQREAFRKAVLSRSIRRFLGVFMETQMFAGFIQDQELRRTRNKGLFEVRVEQYLEELPDTEQGGVNRFFRGLGNKMKFLQKKN